MSRADIAITTHFTEFADVTNFRVGPRFDDCQGSRAYQGRVPERCQTRSAVPKRPANLFGFGGPINDMAQWTAHLMKRRGRVSQLARWSIAEPQRVLPVSNSEQRPASKYRPEIQKISAPFCS
jgi:hypothetical protein